MRGYNEHLVLSSIEKYKIQSVFFIPSIMINLVKSPTVSNYDLSSLIELGCGSAPLSGEIFLQIKQTLLVCSTIPFLHTSTFFPSWHTFRISQKLANARYGLCQRGTNKATGHSRTIDAH